MAFSVVKPQSKKNIDTCCKINYGTFGFLAALTHILSIQTLFFNMAVPTFKYGGAITVVFLMPTFILYIFFSSANPQIVPKIIQENTSFKEMEYELNVHRNAMLKQLVKKGNVYELKQRGGGGQTGGDQSGGNGNDDGIEVKYDEDPVEESYTTTVKNVVNKQIGGGGNLMIDNKQSDEDRMKNGTMYDYIVTMGLCYIENNEVHRKWGKTIVGIAITVATANALLGLFAPYFFTIPTLNECLSGDY